MDITPMPEFYPVDSDHPGPVEVWLTKSNIEVSCRVIFEDENEKTIDVESLSMRGAQREITAWFLGRGYEPAGRWQLEWQHKDEEDAGQEYSRAFRPGKQDVTVAPGLRAANQALARDLVTRVVALYADASDADRQRVANYLKVATTGRDDDGRRWWPDSTGFPRPTHISWA